MTPVAEESCPGAQQPAAAASTPEVSAHTGMPLGVSQEAALTIAPEKKVSSTHGGLSQRRLQVKRGEAGQGAEAGQGQEATRQGQRQGKRQGKSKGKRHGRWGGRLATTATAGAHRTYS